MTSIFKKPNRDEATKPKHGKYPCDKCDGAIVTLGGKCETCGVKQNSKRRKKD